MKDIEIKELVDNLDKLAYELIDSELKLKYSSKEVYIATVRSAQSMIITLQSKLRSKQ